jgi:hypothetical protein
MENNLTTKICVSASIYGRDRMAKKTCYVKNIIKIS